MDNTVKQRTETDSTGSPTLVSLVEFYYDARQRLIQETRTTNSTTIYNLAYRYDQLGNRVWKGDTVSERETTYYYDTVPANRDSEYQTNNNRLLRYEESVDNELVRTVWYTYYKFGHVANITIKDESDPLVRKDLALYYTGGSGMLWMAVWDEWTVDSTSSGVTDETSAESYEITAAREFRYDTGRQRYLVRDVNPSTWQPLSTSPGLWTDYAGDLPYGDFTATSSGSPPSITTTENTRYLHGFNPHAQQTLGTGGATQYLHGDLIDSTNLTTGSSGAAVSTVAYTAFGEIVGGAGTPPAGFPRYQYAGGWGCESGLLSLAGADSGIAPIRLHHVGARWYDAAIGRFVQRDPIGLGGGLNAYSYGRNRPTDLIDPSGLVSVGPNWHDGLPPWEDLLDWLGAGFTGGVGGGIGAAAVGAGAAGAGIGTAVGVGVWFAGKAVIFQTQDLLATLNDCLGAEAANLKQQKNNPRVFPKPKAQPIPPWVIFFLPIGPCGSGARN